MENSNELVWRKAWSNCGKNSPKNFVTKRDYNGFNRFILSAISGTENKPNFWLTFKQIKDKKLTLNVGSKGVPVVFYGKTHCIKVERDDEGNKVEKNVGKWFMKYYYVFNIADTNYDISELEENIENTEEINIDENCTKIIKEYVDRENITYSETESNRAYYSPLRDTVVVPALKQYSNVGDFYSTNFHELVHSTGHKTRLDRFNNDQMVASDEHIVKKN